MTHFTHDIDGDGIALVTWNSPGRTMNVIDAAVLAELSALVEELVANAAVKGVVITSGKDTFCAGADLTMLESLAAPSRSLSPRRAKRQPMRGCSKRAAKPRCYGAASKPAASRGSRRSTAPRWAAASN